MVPLLPLLYLGGMAGAGVLLQRLTLGRAGSAALAAVVLSFLALSLVRASLDPGLPAEKELNVQGERLAVWLRENSPEDYTIGAFAVGIVGYESDRDILDLLGLNDVATAHTDMPDIGEGLAGHEKSNPDYVLEEALPELIIVGLAEPRQLDEDELREKYVSLSLNDPRRAVLADRRLWDRYDVRAARIDDRWFHLLQRADTVRDWDAPGLD
jgi:hypothetical protein